MSSGRELDQLARDLAQGGISRRTALGRLAGAALGVGIASIPGASALAAGDAKKCPKSRRCGDKCCPKHARCKRGKCKCDSGYTKCGKRCVDLQSDAAHCGDCDIACDEGRACIGGTCAECSAAEDCPQADGDCKAATCEDGVCGEVNDDGDFPSVGQCFESTCSDGTPNVHPVAQGAACNENGGSICNAQGDCVVPCSTNADCGGTDSACSEHICQSGICLTRTTEGDFCGIQQCGPPGFGREICCTGGTCSQICSTCYCLTC